MFKISLKYNFDKISFDSTDFYSGVIEISHKIKKWVIYKYIILLKWWETNVIKNINIIIHVLIQNIKLKNI